MLVFFFFLNTNWSPVLGHVQWHLLPDPSPSQHAGNSEPHCGTSHAMNDSWGLSCKMQDQIALLSAAVGNALTTVLAGFALTTTSWPNIIFLVALVAGFLRVLILARPGTVNTPDFLTSVAPTSANLAKSFETTLFFNSELVASTSARAPLPIAFEAAFIAAAFIAAAFIPFGAMVMFVKEASSRE